MLSPMRLIAAVALMVGSPASANEPVSIAEVMAQPQVEKVLDRIETNRAATDELLVRLAKIVSPSGQEQERAAAVEAEMIKIDLADVATDPLPNVTGIIPGRSGQAIIFVSTLDDLATVADHQRAAEKPPYIEDGRIVGPGTNTSLTSTAMLAAARALAAEGVTPEHDLVFAAVAQEETGLKGMRALYDRYKDRAIAFVDILGDSQTISYGALAIHWWKVTAEGPAGHTLGGGLPNVNQGIGRAVDRIMSLPQPAEHADSNTRLNVAILSSGKVFNHKPESGWFSLDIRSLDGSVVSEIEAAVSNVLAQVSRETGITFTQASENNVPGGQIAGALDSPLVRWASAIARATGARGELSPTGSANLNIAIAAGTPAVGIGGERGGRRGFADEWADSDVLDRTARQVALLALTLGDGLVPMSSSTVGSDKEQR